MKKLFTSMLILAALTMSASAFAQEEQSNLQQDSIVDETPVVMGVDSIDTNKYYLLYNKGLNLYLNNKGKAVSTPDSAAAWKFSASQGTATILTPTAEDTLYLSMNYAFLAGWSISLSPTASTLTVVDNDSVFLFSKNASLGGTRYVGFNASGNMAANQANAAGRNQWVLIETAQPEVEERPTVGYRILKRTVSSSSADYVIAYPSVRPDGTEVELSGLVMIPLRNGSVNANHFLLSSHYTMTKNNEVPSGSNPMEASLILSNKPILIAPDYLGYGISREEIHPYVAPEIMARNCVDMITATYHLLEEKYEFNAAQMHLPTYGMGYSQGGSIALANQKFIENNAYVTDTFRTTINYSGTYCGAGPYDPLATLSQYIYQDSLSMPVAAPLLVIGLVASHADLMNGHIAEDYFSNAFNAAHLIDSINSRNYTTGDLNSMIIEACGGGTMHVMLSDSALDLNSELMQPFMKTLGMSNLTRDWTPQAPVHFFHNAGDDVVPFLNTMSAYRGLFEHNDGGIQLSMSSPTSHMGAAVNFMMPLALGGGYRSYNALDSIPSNPMEVKEPGREGISFWWHSVEFAATEGGSIYATGDWRLPLDDDDYGTNVLTQWVVAGANGRSSCYGWAQANEGYTFVGWYTEDGQLLSTDAEEARLFSMANVSANEDGIVNGTSYYPALADMKIIARFAPASDDPNTATDVEQVEFAPADGLMYDILGRRIATSAKGQIYILNGKKYMQR